MKLLLDTRMLLWAAAEPSRLSEAARALIASPEHALYFSVASLWEIVIKRGLGRADFIVEPDYLRKMLVAQARSEGMHLLTADAAILQYKESVYPL